MDDDNKEEKVSRANELQPVLDIKINRRYF